MENWEDLCGLPAAVNPPHPVGATLIYEACEEGGSVIENGEILFVAQEPDGSLQYLVCPATAGFPTPVWPEQILASL